MRDALKLTSLPNLRHYLNDRKLKLVATNGCFDLLHIGHVRLLNYARSLGDYLVVGINSDDSVKALKGPGRPVVPEAERAEMLLALGCVDCVTVFNGNTATEFLDLCRPDVWVKGGDYTIETLDSTEREAVEACGGAIVLFPTVPGYSTTRLVNNARPTNKV